MFKIIKKIITLLYLKFLLLLLFILINVMIVFLLILNTNYVEQVRFSHCSFITRFYLSLSYFRIPKREEHRIKEK